MKKNLLLTLLLGFLIAMNAVLLFLLFNKSDSKKGPPHEFVVQELNFSEEQTERYHLLESKFRQRMRPIHHRTRELKEALFNSVSDEDATEKTVDSLTTLIGNLEKARDTEVVNHFKAIYDLCDSNQKQQFQKLIGNAMHRPGPGGPPPPDGRQGPPPR
ncbi:MAG: Spy/CpxP family protein refolding chaperone [Bacteroidota bacterium]